MSLRKTSLIIVLFGSVGLMLAYAVYEIDRLEIVTGIAVQSTMILIMLFFVLIGVITAALKR